MSRQDVIAAEIPKLRRYARALVGSEIEADDLVQDTLERALGRIHLWRENENPRRWLFTILHNIHIDQKRGSARKPMHAALDPQLPDPTAMPADGVTVCEVNAALQKLPLDQREVLLLVALEGLSYAEASGVLDVPIGTVMSRLSRARDRMRDLIGREGVPTSGGLRRVK
jgi:RNA polymerase sigma-70 factor (ECF subfamily)